VGILDIFLLTAAVVVVVTVALMMAQGAARKSLRSGAKEWLTSNNLSGYMVTFAPGDAIGVNYDKRQMGFSSSGRNLILPFSSLVSVEIVENGSTVSKSSRGSQLLGAAVGGALAGGVGAIIGGLSGASASRQKVSKVSLHVITDSPDAPFFELKVFHDAEIEKGGFVYNQLTAELMPWYGRLKAILESQ
jgi:hypothetical protein